MTQGNNRFKIKYERNMNIEFFTQSSTNANNLNQVLFSNVRRTPSSLTRIANFDNRVRTFDSRINTNYNSSFSMFKHKNIKINDILIQSGEKEYINTVRQNIEPNPEVIELNNINENIMLFESTNNNENNETIEIIESTNNNENNETNEIIESTNNNENNETNEIIESKQSNDNEIMQIQTIKKNSENLNVQNFNIEELENYDPFQYYSDDSVNTEEIDYIEDDFVNNSWNEEK